MRGWERILAFGPEYSIKHGYVINDIVVYGDKVQLR